MSGMNMLQRILDAIAALAAGLAAHVAEMRKQQLADADSILLRVREVGDQVRRQADLAKAQGEALAELRKQQIFDGDFARAVVIDSAKWHLKTIDLLGGIAEEQTELRTALRVEAMAILQKIADQDGTLTDFLKRQIELRSAVASNTEALAKILAVLLPPEAATAVIQFEGADAKGDSKMMFKYGDGPITATLKPLDGKGNVAIIDGRPIWTLAEADISISADGMPAVQA